MVSHERFLSLGKTVMPMRIEDIEDIVGVNVDEGYGSYTVWNTPNSADLGFARIGDRGYLRVYGNPRWIHQFHPDEWPLIYKRLEESPFVDEFNGVTITLVLSEKNWERHYKNKLGDQRGY